MAGALEYVMFVKMIIDVFFSRLPDDLKDMDFRCIYPKLGLFLRVERQSGMLEGTHLTLHPCRRISCLRRLSAHGAIPSAVLR